MHNLKKLPCVLLGHKLYVSKIITAHIKEYKCKRCRQELTTTIDGGLTELTPKFKDINAKLARMYSNRLARIKARRIRTTAA